MTGPVTRQPAAASVQDAAAALAASGPAIHAVGVEAPSTSAAHSTPAAPDGEHPDDPVVQHLQPSSSATSGITSTAGMAGHRAGSNDNTSGRSSSSSPAAKLWSAAQPLLGKYLAPALLVFAATTWLARQARGSGTGSSRPSSSTGSSQQRHKQQRAQQQQQQQNSASAGASAAAAAAAAEPEPPEPESSLAVYASDFSLNTSEVSLVSRPAALEGLTCVVSEHIPIQVSGSVPCSSAGHSMENAHLLELPIIGYQSVHGYQSTL